MIPSTKVFKTESLEASTPFIVILPESESNSEFSVRRLIAEAQKGVMPLEEADRIARNMFYHPDLDLTALFQYKRALHLGLSMEDVDPVKECLEACARDILALREKITSLVSSIVSSCNELSNATSLLQQKMGQQDLCHYLLAPIRYIHQDLLEPIFQACLESDDSPLVMRSNPCLQVSSVCYRWREIACSTPVLWSRVVVNESALQSLSLAKLWVTRCRFPSLTLHLSQGITLERLTELIPPFHESGPQVQIRRLELVMPPLDSEMVISTILDGHGDELEEIVLRHEDRLEDLPEVPHLKRLYLLHEPTSWTQNAPPQHLTVLRITKEIHWEMLEVILVQCTLLQKLLVSISENGNKPEPHLNEGRPKRPIFRPHITYLGFSNDCSEEEFPHSLLSDFVFPSLVVLEYYVDGSRLASTDWLLSLSFLRQVKRLSLQLQYQVPKSFYNAVFALAHSVEELSLYFDVDPMPELFEALVTAFSPSDSLRPLPCLKSIHFSALDELRPTSTEILRVGQAWASITPTSPPNQSRPSLTIHRWDYLDDPREDSDEENQQLLDTLRETCPNLEPNLYFHDLRSWIYDVPVLFEMYPLTFNEVRKYNVLEEACRWAPQTGPIYRIA